MLRHLVWCRLSPFYCFLNSFLSLFLISQCICKCIMNCLSFSLFFLYVLFYLVFIYYVFFLSTLSLFSYVLVIDVLTSFFSIFVVITNSHFQRLHYLICLFMCVFLFFSSFTPLFAVILLLGGKHNPGNTGNCFTYARKPTRLQGKQNKLPSSVFWNASASLPQGKARQRWHSTSLFLFHNHLPISSDVSRRFPGSH